MIDGFAQAVTVEEKGRRYIIDFLERSDGVKTYHVTHAGAGRLGLEIQWHGIDAIVTT
jgi:hypothetical protein